MWCIKFCVLINKAHLLVIRPPYIKYTRHFVACNSCNQRCNNSATGLIQPCYNCCKQQSCLVYGGLFSTFTGNQDLQMSMWTTMLVTRCSYAPARVGFSPGAVLRLYMLSACRCCIDLTEAAQWNGRPKIPHTPASTPTISRSQWYPTPLRSLCSGLLMRTNVS